MKYHCLSQKEYQKGEYSLVPLRHDDILQVRKWRNDQRRILRQQKQLSIAQQNRYFEEEVKPTYRRKEPEMILFSFLKDGECIGYGGLVHIDWHVRKAEVSFLLATERMEDDDLFQGEFARFLTLLFRVREELQLHRLHSELFDIRPKMVEVLQAFGFHLEGLLKDHALVDGEYVDSLIYGLTFAD